MVELRVAVRVAGALSRLAVGLQAEAELLEQPADQLLLGKFRAPLTGARIHDLRHTFAVRSLERCAPERHAIARHLVALSTYLGHARVADTYWYLEATPVLLREVADAGETRLRGAQA